MSTLHRCRRALPPLIAALALAVASRADAADHPFKLLRSIAVDDGHLQWVTFSPDGKAAATCGDRYVRLYDLETGALIREFPAHGAKAGIHRFAFSPDGRLIAASSPDHTVRVWDVASGAPVAILSGHSDLIIGVCFSPDGKWLASASAFVDGTIRIWDCSTWKQAAHATSPPNHNSMQVAFSPDSASLAASGYRGSVRLFRFDGARLSELPPQTHDGGEMTTHVIFSPSGDSFLTSGWDKTLRLWSTKSGAPIWSVPAPEHARCFEAAVFSRDGSRIFTVTRDETIQVREAKTGAVMKSHRSTDEACRGIAISPDGRLLSTVGHSGELKIWQIAGE